MANVAPLIGAFMQRPEVETKIWTQQQRERELALKSGQVVLSMAALAIDAKHKAKDLELKNKQMQILADYKTRMVENDIKLTNAQVKKLEVESALLAAKNTAANSVETDRLTAGTQYIQLSEKVRTDPSAVDELWGWGVAMATSPDTDMISPLGKKAVAEASNIMVKYAGPATKATLPIHLKSLGIEQIPVATTPDGTVIMENGAPAPAYVYDRGTGHYVHAYDKNGNKIVGDRPVVEVDGPFRFGTLMDELVGMKSANVQANWARTMRRQGLEPAVINQRLENMKANAKTYGSLFGRPYTPGEGPRTATMERFFAGLSAEGMDAIPTSLSFTDASIPQHMAPPDDPGEELRARGAAEIPLIVDRYDWDLPLLKAPTRRGNQLLAETKEASIAAWDAGMHKKDKRRRVRHVVAAKMVTYMQEQLAAATNGMTIEEGPFTIPGITTAKTHSLLKLQAQLAKFAGDLEDPKKAEMFTAKSSGFTEGDEPIPINPYAPDTQLTGKLGYEVELVMTEELRNPAALGLLYRTEGFNTINAARRIGLLKLDDNELKELLDELGRP